MDKYNLEERYKDFPSRIEGELYEGFGLGGSSGITVPEAVNASVQSSTRGMKKSALPTLPLDYKEEYEDDDDFDDGDDMR